jgi:hypothetical protein
MQMPFAWRDADDEGIASVAVGLCICFLIVPEAVDGVVWAQGFGQRCADPAAAQY